MVRAKFVVTHKSEDGGHIELSVVTSGSKENESFFKYTPSGQVVLNVVNPSASEEFEKGDEFYVDFTKA